MPTQRMETGKQIGYSTTSPSSGQKLLEIFFKKTGQAGPTQMLYSTCLPQVKPWESWHLGKRKLKRTGQTLSRTDRLVAQESLVCLTRPPLVWSKSKKETKSETSPSSSFCSFFCVLLLLQPKKNLTGPRSFIPSNSMIINVLSPITIIEIEERTERKKMSWKGTKVRGKEEH